MSVKNFKERLRRCMAAGRLTYSDMAHWFSVPRATMVTWVTGANKPRPTRGIELDRRLLLLEHTIKSEAGLPVPHDLSEYKRPTYIREIYHAANNRGVSAGTSR